MPRALLHFTLYLAALFLGTRLIDAAVRAVPGIALGEGTVERAKYVHFARHADEYDFVAVGSSRVMRHFVPEVFDANAARLGSPVRSYNFGVSGMRFPEIEATLNFVLSLRPARLRWALIELQEIDQTFFRRNPFTRRTIHWHGPGVTARLLRAVWASQRALSEKLAETRNHLHHLALKTGNLGTALPLLEHLVGRAPLLAPEDDLGDGFIAFERAHGADFDNAEELMENYAESYGQAAPDAKPHPMFRSSVERLAARLRAAGVEPIWFLAPPVSDWRSTFLRATLADPPAPLWPYHDPERYPQFAKPENVYNRFHLNTRGARLLSIRMARDWVGLARERAQR